MTVIYIDMLLLLNFMANYLLLLGAGRIAGAGLVRWRIALGAMVGAVYAMAVFLPGTTWMMLWPIKLLSGVLMVLIGYGGEKNLLRIAIVFFAAAMGLAGLILAVELLGGVGLTLQNGVVYSQFDIRLLLLLFVIFYFVMSFLFRRVGRHSRKELVKLEIKTGQRNVSLTALLDSGHTLTDPINNRPVIVAEAAYFLNEFPFGLDLTQPVDEIKRCRAAGMRSVCLIPYRAIGVDCGMLLALRADSVTMGVQELGNLYVALSPTQVSDNGTYQALIGGI